MISELSKFILVSKSSIQTVNPLVNQINRFSPNEPKHYQYLYYSNYNTRNPHHFQEYHYLIH